MNIFSWGFQSLFPSRQPSQLPPVILPRLSVAEETAEIVSSAFAICKTRIAKLETERAAINKELGELYAVREALSPAVEAIPLALTLELDHEHFGHITDEGRNCTGSTVEAG